MKRSKSKKESWSCPCVLVLHEHHATIYMDASTQEAFHRSVLRILKGRLSQKDMFFFEDDERIDAERALARKNAEDAWSILRDRFTYEDERIDLEEIKTQYYTENNENAV